MRHVTREQVSGVKGYVRWWGRDAGGRFFGGRKNLVVDSAKTYLADLIRGAVGSTKLAAMAIGTGTAAPAAGDVALGAELARVALPADGTNTATEKNVRAGTVVTLRETFVAPVGTISEAGVFGDVAVPPGAANAGRLFNRALIGPVTSPQSLTIESQFTFQ